MERCSCKGKSMQQSKSQVKTWLEQTEPAWVCMSSVLAAFHFRSKHIDHARVHQSSQEKDCCYQGCDHTRENIARTDSENQFHKKQTLVCAAHEKFHPCQSAGQVLLCKAILITCSWEKKCDFSCLPQLQSVNKTLMQA